MDIRLERSDDRDLIASAQQGDRHAFNELVQKHRHRALGWVKRIVTDHYEVEDIVQDSLMNAFTRLGTLKDMDKFLPWLKTIVRNQAISNLRRSRRQAGVLSLSLIEEKQLVSKQNLNADPSIIHLHNELSDSIQEWMNCLSPRERLVFNAFFIHQLPPDEISKLLNTSKNYIYKTISVSRQKMHRQRLKESIQSYLHTRVNREAADLLLPRTTLHGSNDKCEYSVCRCLYHVQSSIGTAFTLTEIMGFTGHAFRTTIERSSINLSGPYFYDWSTVFVRGFRNLGLISSTVDKPQFNPPVPEVVVQAMGRIDDSLERGVPALLWNAMNPEFAAVYGYDRRRQAYWIEDTTDEMRLGFDQLGQGSNSELFVFTVNGTATLLRQTMLIGALELIIEHAEGKEIGYPQFAYGLHAYDVWIKAFVDDTADVLGNAYSIRVFSQARDYSVHFLKLIETEVWGNDMAKRNVSAAIEHFESAAKLWGDLQEQFPFPEGGQPHHYQSRKKAILLLEAIKAAEGQGISCLRRLLETVLNQRDSGLEETPSA
jgi:RNA polymerase sigma factor, sigma-70 family